MDWLKNIFNNNLFVALSFPSLLSSFTFLSSLLSAMSDGIIDAKEFDHLVASASGIEMIILFLIMYFLRKNNEKK